jgi:hypothetical protein
MADRVVVFLGWQNVYRGAREAFCGYSAPHWEGQVHPVALGSSSQPTVPMTVSCTRSVSTAASRTRPATLGAMRRTPARWRHGGSPDGRRDHANASLPVRLARLTSSWGEAAGKGIDVALAIAFVSMAVTGDFEVGVLMSTDRSQARPGGDRPADSHAEHQS